MIDERWGKESRSQPQSASEGPHVSCWGLISVPLSGYNDDGNAHLSAGAP